MNDRIKNFEEEVANMTKQHQAELKRLQEDMEARHEEEMNELNSKHQEETREMQKQMDDLKTEVGAR